MSNSNYIKIEQLFRLTESEYNMMNTISGNLLFACGDKRAFAVTSCHDGDGKSTIALRLAYSLAKEGYRVVFTDADFCGSSPFDCSADESEDDTAKNCTGYLNGECKLSDIVYTTDVSNLYIIPRTKFNDNSAPTASDFRCLPSVNTISLSALKNALAQAYDYVIFDTPSAEKTIDAAKIASVCDGIVFVVRYGSTRKKDIAEVVGQLEKSGKPVLGFVINQVKFDRIISRKRYRFPKKTFIGRIFRRNSGGNYV